MARGSEIFDDEMQFWEHFEVKKEYTYYYPHNNFT